MSASTLNDVNLAAVGSLVEKIRAAPEVANTTWAAQVTWKGAFRSAAKIRDFDPVPSDEPAALGGTDSAPNPVEQLLGALGNCLAVGYAANASVAGIELRGVTINLDGDIDLKTFLGLADANAGYEAIRVSVDLDAPEASPQQLRELHDKVVGTSPVGHTLSQPVALKIELTSRAS